MSEITPLFASPIYRARLDEHGAIDVPELEAVCLSVAEDDEAGQDWAEANGYPGYTSYASLTDLPWRFDVFGRLVTVLDAHVGAFAEALALDLGEGKLVLEDIWINILPEGGSHSGHIHPHSVISGTTYIAMPKGASAIRFEDPRLPMMMAHPPRRRDAAAALRSFSYVTPDVGDVLLWESFVRHEVPLNTAEEERISVSFNYKWV